MSHCCVFDPHPDTRPPLQTHRNQPTHAIFSAVNMGMYTYLSPKAFSPYTSVLLLYEVFMIGMQILLLNLLVCAIHYRA